eukprot:gb/GEZN01023437.1/.p1 GENE.gb/GEZN01023437.1/~~gb/GEZN01023437.1/.p1  ORF type:complete len:127 (+),score=16.20 gb/GEZN01023437.1/:204-584(+)
MSARSFASSTSSATVMRRMCFSSTTFIVLIIKSPVQLQNQLANIKSCTDDCCYLKRQETNEKSTVKISKVVVVLVSVFLGLLFLGAGAVMYRRKAAETEIGRAGAHVQAQRGLDSDYRSFGAVANN